VDVIMFVRVWSFSYNWFTPLSVVLCLQQLVLEPSSFEGSLTTWGGFGMAHTKDTPLFDGPEYALWKVRMEAFLISLGYDIWKCIKSNYSVPKNGVNIEDEVKATKIDGKTKLALLSGHTNSELVKVVNLKTANEICKRLESVYEGDEKVKQAKM